MALLSKILVDATGLTEEEIKAKLLKLIPKEKYQRIKGRNKGYNLWDNPYGEKSWGFLTDCLGSDPDRLISILKT